MNNINKEVILKGIPASPGICHGNAMLFYQGNIDIPSYTITADEVDSEISRFEKALIDTRSEILNIRNKVSNSLGDGEALIFDAHLMVLEDNALITEILQYVKSNKRNIEYCFNEVVERYINFFKTIEDDYLRERVADIKDVSRRLLNNLLGEQTGIKKESLKKRIIVSEDISPSQAVGFDKDSLHAFITDSGGATSHFVIMARSLKIPAVVGLHNATQKINTGDFLLIDGFEGIVILNPSQETLDKYQIKASERLEIEKAYTESLYELTETKDGHKIDLMVNIEGSKDINDFKAYPSDGIGLFRTEGIFLKSRELPSEEDQFNEYVSVIKAANGKPVIIRTLDVGGDKLIQSNSDDSFLGLRAIRFCLENLDLFKTQLRAILRASAYGMTRIMYPMISGVEELSKANSILGEVKDELSSSGIKFDTNIQVGAMIELPSAVNVIDMLSAYVDFFSVGTNDLIQYLMAVDRMNDRVSHLYQPTHPAVLRSLKTIFEKSKICDKPVSVCGEMASEPIYAALLIGLGADSLSISGSRIPEVKHFIRTLDYSKLKSFITEIWNIDKASLVEEKLKNLLSKL